MALVWLALTYNLPANPSRNRVYVWRKLKEMGAEYFRQGMCILPSAPENAEQFRKLSQKIRSFGGESTLVELRFLEEADEREVAERFHRQAQVEYNRLLEEARNLLKKKDREDSRVRRLLRQIEKTLQKDPVPGGLTEEMESGFQQVMEALRAVPGDFGAQLRGALEENRRRKNQKP